MSSAPKDAPEAPVVPDAMGSKSAEVPSYADMYPTNPDSIVLSSPASTVNEATAAQTEPAEESDAGFASLFFSVCSLSR